MDVLVILPLACSLCGAIVGVLTLRINERKGIVSQAAWQARVDASLLSVEEHTREVLKSLERSERRIRDLEMDSRIMQHDLKRLVQDRKEGVYELESQTA